MTILKLKIGLKLSGTHNGTNVSPLALAVKLVYWFREEFTRNFGTHRKTDKTLT